MFVRGMSLHCQHVRDTVVITIAKEMNLEGDAIPKFVKEQQDIERQARAARREKEQEKIVLKKEKMAFEEK